MNGSLPSNMLDIKLKRGSAGLGFNIVGGMDQEYVLNDSGIYVSKIKNDGAAGMDGRLNEGDKILAINGVQLEGLTHKATVDLFRMAGEDVQLLVLKRSPHSNGPLGSGPDPNAPLSALGILVVLAGAAALCAFIYMRQQRRPF
ncbi:hypothetical protein CesoFtcFv8_017823 [Champsocephalus esox]|uniref:Synaptojanin-2-binding protein n=1 Tax=Champsocephalus esox TaxID=159716 RepID=A0AAN8GS68_9TELE|nr:hypothetical protein CesoFtcFv8_017823 [Champsocephalus esox]